LVVAAVCCYDVRVDVLRAFEIQASACEALGSPMYAALLERMVEELRTGTVVSDVVAGHVDVDPRASALPLRLLGSVHRLVLERRAGELAAYFPSVGGVFEVDGAWTALLRLLRERPDEVREWLDRPPQTNEPGRSAALYGGLLQLPRRRPVRLFEIGSSAGLNLRADQYTYLDDRGRRFGSTEDRLVFEGAWSGRPLTPEPPVRLVERVGCDVAPLDPTTTEGRLALTAYVWPDQQPRLERLRAALRIALDVPAEVCRESAADLVAGLEPQPGAITVIWHSVMWQYLDASEKARAAAAIEDLGARASDDAPVAHLRFEPTERGWPFEVRLRTWPGGEERLLGEAAPHGLPATWS
jgi:hypothetical protein